MSNEWAPSNDALNAAISKCNSPEEIRELAKASLASQGIISRDREDGNYGARVLRQPERTPDASSLPAADGMPFTKTIRWAESTGRRPLVIRAATAELLQELENEILYGHS